MVLHQYAYHGQGKTIHSSPQMEAFGITIDDKSIKTGGTQTITAHRGFVLPLDIKDGLLYMLLRPPSARECQTLPQIFLTGDTHWDLRILDFSLSDSSKWTTPLEILYLLYRITHLMSLVITKRLKWKTIYPRLPGEFPK